MKMKWTEQDAQRVKERKDEYNRKAREKRHAEKRHVLCTLYFKYGARLTEKQRAFIQKEIDQGHP